MGNVLVENNTLKDIADSIRIKNHSEDRYKPGDMPGAIGQIKTGGKLPDDSLPIKFFDYDGRLLYSYSLEELQELTVLPELPEHDGLIGQGWNWTLEQIKGECNPVHIGAHYITDDGGTRLYIRIDTHEHTPIIKFGQDKAYGVTVDWGDGSEPETFSQVTFSYYSYVEIRHKYKNEGNYVITLLPDEDTTMTIASSNTNCSWLIGSNSTYANDNKLFNTALDKVELGRNVTIGENAFNNLQNLKSITVPLGQYFSGNRSFYYCYNLKYLTVSNSVSQIDAESFLACHTMSMISFPKGLNRICEKAFFECFSLREVALPSNIKVLEKDAFAYCKSMERITCSGNLDSIMDYCFAYSPALREADVLSDGMTVMSQSIFMNCMALRKIVIPATIEEIQSAALYLNYALTDVFVLCDVPPVAAVNIFNMASDHLKIYVKQGLGDVYKQADFWSNFSDKIVEME